MFKPANILGSALLASLGKLIASPRLLIAAVNLDPINVRAKLYLLQQKNLSRETYYRILFDSFELFSYLKSGLTQQPHHQPAVLTAWAHSESQLYQDLFVLSEHRFKRDGFFVEIGVGDGKSISNTYLLERDFGWRGILVEPNRQLAKSIQGTRSAALDQRAVFSKSGLELDFLVDDSEVELSTLANFKDSDKRSRQGQFYKVATVTLNDLLAEHHAPEKIDYISIDTEGSELEILQAFDFSKYQVSILTVEHNYDQSKQARLKELLEANGFTQVAAGASKWDAWFISKAMRAAWSKLT